jgi:DNA recombination protein RmuC
MAAKVLIATPTTLIAMLRTVAYSWQQEALTANAREVFELGRELYRRLGTLGGHAEKLGRSLSRSVEDYNALVGSLERKVLVQARRMSELQVTDTDLTAPTPVEAMPRPLGAPELLGSAEELRDLRVVPRHGA